MSRYGEDPPVYRTRPLLTGELRGNFLVAEAVIAATRDALLGFALAGIREGGHEGLVFWSGLEQPPLTALTSVVVPDAEHSKGSVFVSARSYGRATTAAKRSGVAVLAQVHSHPGDDARHSDGDDDLIIMPFEGMLSIVVPNYGIGWTEVAGARVHQFQDGTWTLCTSESVGSGIATARALIDARRAVAED